jgi:hypothetical protein
MVYVLVMRATAIDALRRSALLASSLPGIRLRLTHEGQILAVVDGTGGRRIVDGVLHLGTGAFRRAVADAWKHQAGGGRVAMLGLAEDIEPEIHVGVSSCGTVRPGNVLVVRQAGAWVYAFASTLDLAATSGALSVLAEEPANRHPSAGSGGLVTRIDLHHDDDLATTLVWTEAPPDPCPTRDYATMQVVNDALTACAVAELEHELPAAMYA